MIEQSPKSCLSHLECSRSGDRIDASLLRNLSLADAPLLARYDVQQAAMTLRRDQMNSRPLSIWRYAEMLPQPGETGPVTLSEGMAPLIPRRASVLTWACPVC